MEKPFQEVVTGVEPISDSIYGPRYRCALTLKDGTHLPCAILQSKSTLVELAKRRLKEESSWKRKIRGPDSYPQGVHRLRADQFAIGAGRGGTPGRYARRRRDC